MPKLDKQDQRIAAIFGTPDVPAVSTETLERYLAYLKQHLVLPCQVTGTDPFAWEDYYVVGPGCQADHARLRQTRPSSMDTYDLLRFEGEVDPDDGILVHVRRDSDTRPFLLPLAHLEATRKTSPNYQLLEDYAAWFTNWR
jgi:hypothetical protein